MYAKKSNLQDSKNGASSFVGKFCNPFVIVCYSVALVVASACFTKGCSYSACNEYEEMENRLHTMKLEITRLTQERDEYRERMNEIQEQMQNLPQQDSSPRNRQSDTSAQSMAGRCRLSRSMSPIDDSEVAIVSCVANERDSRSYKEPGCLVVRHKEGEDCVYIVFDDYLGSGSIALTMRIDSGNAETTRWSISTDGKAAFYKGDVSMLINQFCCSQKLTIRATPFGVSPRTYTFDITNFRTVIAPVRYLFR